MKSLYLSMVFILLGIVVFAQNDQGVITYKQVVKIEIKLEGDAAQFAGMLPKERKSIKSLTFNTEAALYQKGEGGDDETMDMEQGGARVMIKMDEPDNKTFTDLKNSKFIEKREFMTRVFLIEGETGKNKWKFTGNQKTILDYPCQEAILEGEEEKTSVWFTPVIPVSAGPEKFGGLPGVVLAVDINDGKNSIVATEVELKKVDKKLLVKPKKGKKVTSEEYDKIVEEKMKEMGGEHGKGGNRMMIQIHR